MELSCDEIVIKQMGNDIKKDYSISLLSLSTGKRRLGGCPLSFGENSTKGRIKNVLNYKKTALWVLIVTVITVIIVGIGLLVNPKTKDTKTLIGQFLSYKTEFVGDNAKVGGIIQLLSFPPEFQYDSFELQTSQEPYGMTIYFSTDEVTEKQYDDASQQNRFRINSHLLLSLVGSLDSVEYVASDEKKTRDALFQSIRDR